MFGLTSAEVIERNRKATWCPAMEYELAVDESRAAIRQRGSFVTKCELTTPDSGEVVPVLYRDGDLRTPKLRASHPMSPVGPDDGPGGPDGWLRWVDFDRQEGATQTSNQRWLETRRTDTGLVVRRGFGLFLSCLVIDTTLHVRRGGEEVDTSVGDHLYFSLPQGGPEDILLEGSSIDDVLSERGAAAAIKQGEPRFWRDFPGTAGVAFPDGRNIELDVEAEFLGSETDPKDQLGMLIWHLPDTPSICLEPTFGFDGVNNAGLHLRRFNAASLATGIRLLES